MDIFFIKIDDIIAILFDGLLSFFVVHITNSLKEEQRENILFICAGIDAGAEQNC